MLIYHGITLLLLSVLVLIVGLIKPKLLLFWMDKPGRFPVVAIAIVVFMIGAVLFGEGNKQKQAALAEEAARQAAPNTAVAPATKPK